MWSSPGIFLIISSTCEVSSPELERLVSVGEHIIILCGPSHIYFWNCINILRWSRILKFDILIMIVKILNKFIYGVKIHLSISICKIITKYYKQVTSLLVVIIDVSNILIERKSFLINIISFQCDIIYYWIITRVFIKVHSNWWRTIVPE